MSFNNMLHSRLSHFEGNNYRVDRIKTSKPCVKKSDDRRQKMLYFGVEDGTNTPRLYDRQHEKIHVSRAVFEEEKK